uniref:(northern house mosquito) hypothetical protein n=1 Tax=Culex pipiens TaxID=7175 RepID=A0A8D8JSU0_CULPI
MTMVKNVRMLSVVRDCGVLQPAADAQDSIDDSWVQRSNAGVVWNRAISGQSIVLFREAFSLSEAHQLLQSDLELFSRQRTNSATVLVRRTAVETEAADYSGRPYCHGVRRIRCKQSAGLGVLCNCSDSVVFLQFFVVEVCCVRHLSVRPVLVVETQPIGSVEPKL